jgi:hypothetical protein
MLVFARAGSAGATAGCGRYIPRDVDQSRSIGKTCDRNIAADSD